MKAFFNDYQAWTSTTAVFPKNHASHYLALGIADEACAELLASIVALWNTFLVGRQKAAAVQHMLKEAGDVLWYVSQYLVSVDVKLADVIGVEYDGRSDALQVGTSIAINSGIIAGIEKKRLRDGEKWNEALRVEKERTAVNAAAQIVAAISSLATGFDSSLADVASMNRAKLSDRKDRGVLNGDGDNR